MRIINIVDSIEDINSGVWGAAISTSFDMVPMNIESECWFFEGNRTADTKDKGDIKFIKLASITGSISELIKRHGLETGQCIIVSHGSWRSPTRLAYRLALRGYKWVYVPQGMLEPWSMRQKHLKKATYLSLIEKPMVRKASLIRAVSSPELNHLGQIFPGQYIIQIPNGVRNNFVSAQDDGQQGFLFMSRLHEKKGVVPLVQGWVRSGLHLDPGCHLYIAGPDHGELVKIRNIIESSNIMNVSFCGILDDQGKIEYFSKSDFFILPSFSEGFPTSVIEAMAAGLTPIISSGCNFPEAFEAGMALRLEPDVDVIAECLQRARRNGRIGSERRKSISEWTRSNYSIDKIAKKQIEIYRSLL